MSNKLFYSTLFFILCHLSGNAQTQTDSTAVNTDLMVVQDSVKRRPLNILAPSKAAFYSAVLPGLGQAYNKKYWKIPIVYAALGTGIYFYVDNSKQYDRYRDAYKRRLAGFKDDEFWGEDSEGNPLENPRLSKEGLIRAQKTLRSNKEVSLLVTLGLYALNIIDANVDAHLLQYNIDENLALKPHFKYNEQDNSSDLGLTLNFKF
ncbi:DUF5683 domain-containing protein [Mangrovimonas xylaniphaga]|uniref:DUF5683 domain-containing protein n=1 Tax=Mangrovimonas xylaniphaga TaxID=1645915 RepID=UPI0006B4DCD6|nr:DUF5683 domain-containing protein [Mangrovimonas xylaniphaga]